ncbi:Guanine nucleotide-exchange factor S12 [Pichia californica]|uniref:Guanine nucleotide-exchange factor SEC12 n=1 Tax=Pichia californica TaxID=460514 RepID=A0A9P6WQK0_9ASCO|nr:Guanine nucleotide-exchange factor S12 [[Candida] californica]KAG0691271.1 Guanine nucleotide-exchange factor S12 [[Candida] californica]
MVKLKSHSINVGYPVYGAQFVNNNTLIVAGGGGDGNNGIPNKMTAILIQPDNIKKPLKRYRELTLSATEDSVMSLAVGNGTIIAGINENPLMMSKGVNKHLRKFKFENDHLKFVESCQIHPNTSSTIYQKITAISHDGSIGVIVMSDSPSSVYIVETIKDMEEKFKIVTEGDVKDVTISMDGKLMCYITASVFEVISLVTGRSVYKSNIEFIMSKIRFLDNNDVIISGSKNKDAVIAKFSISTSKIIDQRVVFKNLKGITSMDVNVKNNLTVLATSNYSLLIIRSSDLKIVKILNKVHEFAITKVTFSDDGKYLASTSAANSVNVIEIPTNFSASKSVLATLFQYIFSIILIALLSIGAQFLYANGYLNVAVNKVVEIYETFKPQDSSEYFTMEPISSRTSTASFMSRSKTSMREPMSTAISTSISSSIEEITNISSEVLSSVLDNTDYLVGDVTSTTTGETASSTTETPFYSSSDYVSSISEEIIPTEHEILQQSIIDSDVVDATIKDDIISSHDIDLTDYELSITETASLDEHFDEPVSTTFSPVSETSIDFLDSTAIKEVTREVVKEVVKEITSTIVATETSVHTSIHTSTSLVTSVETVVSTETSVSISTSVILVTVTQEPDENSQTVDSPKHFQVELKEIENDERDDDIIVVVDEENHTIETLNSEEIGSIAKDSVSIQIEPTTIVYNDSKEAIADQEKQVKEELEQIEESKTVEAEVSIQIEPSSVIYENPVEAAENERSLVEEELQNTATAVAPSLDINPITPIMMHQADGAETTERTTTSTTSATLSPSLDIKPITPIMMLQADGPETTEIITSETVATAESMLDKDEL